MYFPLNYFHFHFSRQFVKKGKKLLPSPQCLIKHHYYMDNEQQKATMPTFRTQDGQPFEVPEEGSLGLLALGYVGLMAWRQKRQEAMVDRQKQKENQGSE